MKKILSAVIVFCVMIFSANCYAYIDKSRCAIGGLQIYNSPSYVKKIYGEPDRTESRFISKDNNDYSIDLDIDTWFYGDSLEIQFWNGEVIEIHSTKNNGLKTPDGITVGMKSVILFEKYGQPDERFDEGIVYHNTGTGHSHFIFGVKNGIIYTISLAGHYP